MRIIVFGTNKCKFCDKQYKFLSRTFDKSDWLYINVSNDVNALKIADKVKIDKVPAIVLLDNNQQELFRAEGTMPPDRIFNTLFPSAKAIPFKSIYKKALLDGQINFKILSCDTQMGKGDKVTAMTYGGKTICSIKIKSCEKLKIDELGKKCGKEIVSDYIKSGGRGDLGWLIYFDRTLDEQLAKQSSA